VLTILPVIAQQERVRIRPAQAGGTYREKAEGKRLVRPNETAIADRIRELRSQGLGFESIAAQTESGVRRGARVLAAFDEQSRKIVAFDPPETVGVFRASDDRLCG
jgi:DNA invertase Pin-like site-specific DNA recombinase